jgi:hypothetical protein
MTRDSVIDWKISLWRYWDREDHANWRSSIGFEFFQGSALSDGFISHAAESSARTRVLDDAHRSRKLFTMDTSNSPIMEAGTQSGIRMLYRSPALGTSVSEIISTSSVFSSSISRTDEPLSTLM